MYKRGFIIKAGEIYLVIKFFYFMDIEKNDEGIDLSVGYYEEKQEITVKKGTGTPTMARWVIAHSHGMIQNSRQATFVLWFLVVLMLSASVFILVHTDQVTPYSMQKTSNLSK